jgi:anti-anti-sigma regulatory factor
MRHFVVPKYSRNKELRSGYLHGIIPALGEAVNDSIVVAPVHLGAQTRAEFRDEALAALARLEESTPGGRLVIDMTRTQRLDSAGLGTLVMLQLRAAERRHAVALRGASEEIRFLLLMTRLEDRFTIDA